MSTTKRKAVTEERPNKKAKPAQAEEKRKPSTAGNHKATGERKTAAKSILLQEERSFPRGGASVLTPIEQKQIRAQAEKDVLFEHRTGQKAPKSTETDGDFFEEDEAVAAAPTKKKRKVQGSKEKSTSHAERSGKKIHGLSYKSLVPGSIVLGRVTAITSKDLALALPNNLTGYVPITAISEKLNSRIESLLNDDVEGQEEENENEDDIELQKLFYVGQWLRGVVAVSSSEQAQNKRHIELSIDPQQVNGKNAENIVVNTMLQASVRSVEDHGVVMDLGFSSTIIKGFVSKKELGSALSLKDIQAGQTMLCLVTGKGSDGKVLKLSPDAARFSVLGNNKHSPVVTEAPVVDAFFPGTAIEALVTDVSAGGLIGKVMGLVDITADSIHSGVAFTSSEEFAKKCKIGSKVQARIIWSLPSDDGSRQLGVSLLKNILALPPPPSKLPSSVNEKLRASSVSLDQQLPTSTIIDDATVAGILTDRGLVLNLPAKKDGPSAFSFAHISQLSDTHVQTLSSTTGAYKIGSTHRARVLAFNPVDSLYYMTLKESVLSQSYLRLEDLTVGEQVDGKVDRLILGGGSQGVTGVLVKLGDHITALVPELHMSDVALQHPERKFREGFAIKGRVLSVDLGKRQARLTLKKTLVNDEANPIWRNFTTLQVGDESKGTIVKLLEKGAVVQFYGQVRAFLPISEMSESYVENPSKHFRLGQTVTARVLDINPDTEEMRVSCKAAGDMDEQTQKAWDAIEPGQILSGSVTAPSADKVELELEGGVRGLMRVGHVIDGSSTKAESMIKRLRVGQRLNELVVLHKLQRSQQVLLTNKASFISDAKENKLVRAVKDAVTGQKVHGFVRNVTPEGVYVEFVGETVALLPKNQILPELISQPSFGLRKDQTINAWVLYVDEDRQRFALTMRESTGTAPAKTTSTKSHENAVQNMDNPVDSSLSTTADLTLNKVTKATVASVKNTQVNVRLADGVHGRIDASEVFDTWEEIKNAKTPLQAHFKVNQTLDVKVLGIRDARGWRFLPFSHRGRGNAVVELSAKRSRLEKENVKLLNGLSEVKKGEIYVGFINNIAEDCIWVSLSPGIRGRVLLMDLSNDVGLLQDVGKHFPVGSALQVRVKNVSPETNRLDLTTRLQDMEESTVTLDTLAPNEVVPGRVTKVSDRAVTVQLSQGLAGPVPLVELSDDFDNVDTARYAKNDIVRVRVLSIDRPNKKVFLSLRPSLALSSSLPVKDLQIASLAQVKPGLLVRGFVKHIGEKGILVSLSGTVDAFVRIGDLSDDFIKDWQSHLQVDQLVRGRVIAVDEVAKHVYMSLKASHVDENYKPPLKLEDLKSGMVVTGKARKVEDFGVFVDIDGTQPRLSGLAHRSQIAEKRVADVRSLFNEGDKVKAKILTVNVEDRKISLGLKASYFKDEDEDIPDADDDDEFDADDLVAAPDVPDDHHADHDGGVELEDVDDNLDSDASDADGMEVDSDNDDAAPTPAPKGLKTTGFDWTGEGLDATTSGAAYESEPETDTKKKKRTKAEIKVDLTGDLDKFGPQSVSDFERQLLGQPNDSGLWIQYMAFQLQLSEIQKAREIAERALRTIHIRDVDEKANIWIAWLNLEVEYGDDERVEEVFKQACQVQEPLGMHEKLASIYVDSGKHDKADALFDRIVGNKAFRASPEVWLNYASFLMSPLKEPVRARALLPRALQSIAKSEHRQLTAKFAALEFRTAQGDPERGRTIFEGLVSEWPKWATGWDMWVDIERARAEREEDRETKKEAVERVRKLYERMTEAGMKKRRAKFVFKRWLEFEEKHGDVQGQEQVKTRAKEFVDKLQARGDDDQEA